MTIAHLKHWIFDMDGTLTMAMHDFDAIRAELEIKAGVPILEAIDEMPQDLAKRKMTELFDIEMKIAMAAKPQPGAAELLEHLHSQDCPVGILTRNDCEIAFATLKAAGLMSYFEKKSILGRESCAPKPDPAGIFLHLSRWNAEATDTVMVGDYRFDLEAGRNAGTSTVHLDVDNTNLWPELTTVRVSTLQALLQQLD